MPKIPVLDSHIHLALGWQDGSGLPNSWLKEEPTSFHRDWTEKDLNAFGLHFFVFVHVLNATDCFLMAGSDTFDVKVKKIVVFDKTSLPRIMRECKGLVKLSYTMRSPSPVICLREM